MMTKTKGKLPAHSMTDEGEFSLAKIAKEKLGQSSRVSGVKGDKKSAKREGKAKMRQRKYHYQEAESVKYRGIKKVATGFDTGKHNGVMGHYNIRADPMLGKGFVAMRRIPVAASDETNSSRRTNGSFAVFGSATPVSANDSHA